MHDNVINAGSLTLAIIAQCIQFCFISSFFVIFW